MAERPNENLKVPLEDIELRVRPRPVSRINRKVLIGGTAIVSIVLMGAVLFALNPPDWRGVSSRIRVTSLSWLFARGKRSRPRNA